MTIREEIEILNACINRQSELLGEWARRNGMSRSTVMVLYALDRDHAGTQKEIADWWLLPKQTVHSVVKALERQELVELSAGRDQKEKRVRLTRAGERFVADRMQSLYEREERALESLAPDLREGLVRGSQTYTQALEREIRHGS